MAKTTVQCSDEGKRLFSEAAKRLGLPQWEAVDLAARSLATQAASIRSAAERARDIEDAMTGEAHKSATEANGRRSGVRHESNTDATAVS